MKKLLNKQFSVKSLLIVILIAILSITALGAVNDNIQAILSREFRITYNGAIQEFKDADGNTVYPLVYNGTTYLPIRAVSSLVGLDIEWEAATKTVKLSTKEPGEGTRLTEVGKANYGVTPIADMSLFPEYKFGLMLTGFNRAYRVDSDMPLEDRYERITFDVALVSLVEKQLQAPLDLKLLNADTGVLLWEGRCEQGQILTDISVDIRGVTKLRWSFIGGDMQNEAVGYILDPYVE